MGKAQDDDLVMTLVDQALSQPLEERETYVRSACDGDAELFDQVWDYVNSEGRMNEILPHSFPVDFELSWPDPAPSEDPFQPGDLLAERFLIESKVGEGGMGVVYKALDKRLDPSLPPRIAIKCAKTGFGNRLPPEVRHARAIGHPNVCKIFDIHTAFTAQGEIDFLSMEFLEGETLAKRLQAGPLAESEARTISNQLCAGLAEAHRNRVIHGDLKSNNVILTSTPDGTVRAVITDFGLARRPAVPAEAGAPGRASQSAPVGGARAYMAPELRNGQPATVQSDIYALGVLLFEMFCGRRPFPEETALTEPLPAVPRAPNVREPLRSAISRCLRPDPKRRFQSVGEFENAIRSVSRRAVMGGLVGLSATSLTAKLLWDRYWSTVRLAMLPASIDGADVDSLPVISGFLHDLSYSLQTLHGLRRPLRVVPPTQTAAEGVTTAAGAKATFGATHAMTLTFRQQAARWSIAVEIAQISAANSLQHWNRVATRADLAAQLFRLHSSIVEQTAAKLLLRAEHQPQTLPPEVYADYLQGLYYARNEDEHATKAIPFFERVIESAPDSPLGHVGLAEALLGARYETGKKSLEYKALTELAKAERLDPEVAHVYLMEGRLHTLGNSLERALGECQRAAALAPNDSEAFIQMGYIYYMIQRPHDAEAALLSAISAEPEYYKPYLEIGLFYFKQRDLASAERYWLKAVRLGLGQTQARLNLAQLYMAAGRPADAEILVDESLKIARKQSTLVAMGDLRDWQGHYEQAIAAYEEAIRVGPPSYTIWAGLGIAYTHTGREADAVGAFNNGLQNTLTAEQNYPRDPETVAWRAYYYAKLRDIAETRSAADQALAMPPHPNLTSANCWCSPMTRSAILKRFSGF